MIAAWHSADRMRALLDRERARSDRSGRPFCLLTFEGVGPSGLNLAALDAILRHRLRCTDEFGWMGEATVGVLLPETEPAGADCLGEAIVAEYPADRSPIRRELYSYPSVPRPGIRDVETDRPARVRALEPLFARPLPRGKRALDIAGAIVGLAITAPFFLACAAAIRISSRGPILIRQPRAGLGGRPFTMLKFRTMRCDAGRQGPIRASDCAGPPPKDPADPRITNVGRLLRRWSLDELPQFWNVLRGEMSLVGPRPLILPESDACEPWQRRRLDVMPGMTCIWQVSGRSTIPFVEWARMDLRYGQRRSWLADVKLILRTIPAVLSGRGAF